MIHVVWGTGTGPTGLTAYDAALADANVHNYNLVTVSSIIPAGVSVDAVGTAPDLGPAGNRLTVVEAKATVRGPGTATAGLGWATGNGPGLFWEAADTADGDGDGDRDDTEATIRQQLRRGLAVSRDRRDWTFTNEEYRVTSVEAAPDTCAVAVVLGVYGESDPIL